MRSPRWAPGCPGLAYGGAAPFPSPGDRVHAEDLGGVASPPVSPLLLFHCSRMSVGSRARRSSSTRGCTRSAPTFGRPDSPSAGRSLRYRSASRRHRRRRAASRSACRRPSLEAGASRCSAPWLCPARMIGRSPGFLQELGRKPPRHRDRRSRAPLGVLAVEKEGAEGGLAIARRPDLPAPLKALAWLWTNRLVRNAVSPPASSGAFQRSLLEVGRRMDVEDGRLAGADRAQPIGKPERRIIRHLRPRDPTRCLRCSRVHSPACAASKCPFGVASLSSTLPPHWIDCERRRRRRSG